MPEPLEIWSADEKEPVAQAWSVPDAIKAYRAKFGNGRTDGAIKLEWFRQHPRIHHGVPCSWQRAMGKILKAMEGEA
jgi:hypothetical protein